MRNRNPRVPGALDQPGKRDRPPSPVQEVGAQRARVAARGVAPRAARRPRQDSRHVGGVHGVGVHGGAVGALREPEPCPDGRHPERGAPEQPFGRPPVYPAQARQELSLARRRASAAARPPHYAVVDEPLVQAGRPDPRHYAGLVRDASASRPRRQRGARLREPRAAGRLVARPFVLLYLPLAHAHSFRELALRHAEADSRPDQGIGQPLKVVHVGRRGRPRL